MQRADSILALAEAADERWVEPSIARGWVALDRAGLQRGLEAAPWIEQGIAHAQRALEIEPNHPPALALRGTLRFEQYKLKVTPDPAEQQDLLSSARKDLESAVQADPTLAAAHVTLSYLYYEPGIRDVSSALLAAQRGYEQDAYLDRADRLLLRLFWGHIDLEQFTPARRWCAEGAKRFPSSRGFISCQLWLMVTPAVPPDVDGAWALLSRYDSLTPAGSRLTWQRLEKEMLVAGVLARGDLPDSARSVLAGTRARVTTEIDPHQSLLPVDAYVLTLLKEADEAIDLLKRYVAANPEHDFPATAGTVWWWRDLRGHPRFKEITGGN